MKFLLFICTILFHINLVAYFPQSGIRALSLGKAYSSIALSNDIIFYNPSGILKYKNISLDIDYHSIDKQNNLIISLVDSKSTDWALGILYDLQIPKQKIISHNAYITTAIALIKDILFFGTSFNYIYDKKNSFTSMDFGILLDTETGLSFALSNLHSFYFSSRHLPANITLGISYDFYKIFNTTQIMISTDWQMNDAFSDKKLQHELSFGIQYILLEALPIRLGYNHKYYNEEKIISFGTGFVANSIDLDLLYRQNLIIGKNRDFGASIKLRF